MVFTKKNENILLYVQFVLGEIQLKEISNDKKELFHILVVRLSIVQRY